MKILISLLAILSCYAQSTAVFPRRVATNSDLFVATNSAATTLVTGINASATSATVASTSGITAPALVTIDSEIFAVCQVTGGNTLRFGRTSCPNVDGRGVDGTSAASHLASRAIQGRVVALQHNQMAAEIKAIEDKLHREIPSIVDFGATGNETTDDTTAIQATLNAATAGQMVYCPKGIYKITAPITVPAYVTFYGPRTDLQSGQATQGGCTLAWYGAAPAAPYVAGSGMVNLHSIYGAKIDGINLDGRSTANLSGFLLDTDLTVPSQRNEMGHMTMQNFGNPITGVAGACMVLGTSTTGVNQVDGNDIGNFLCTNANVGIRVYSPNFTYSKIHSGAIGTVNKAFQIAYGGDMNVEAVVGGPFYGVNPKFFSIEGPYDVMTLSHIQAEADLGSGNPAQHLYVAPGLPLIVTPITMMSSMLEFPSTIESGVHIVSIGNRYMQSVTIPGNDVSVVGVNDAFAGGASVVITGINSTWMQFPSNEANGTVQTWRTGDQRDAPNQHFTTETRSGKTHDYNTHTAKNGQKFRQDWSTTKFCQVDETAAVFPFLCGDAGMSGADGLQMHHGYSTLNGLRVDSTGSFRIWIATQGGVDNAITVTTPNGLEPPQGAMVSVHLTTNTLQAAGPNTISFNGGGAHPILRSVNGAYLSTAFAINGVLTGVIDIAGNFRVIGQ